MTNIKITDLKTNLFEELSDTDSMVIVGGTTGSQQILSVGTVGLAYSPKTQISGPIDQDGINLKKPFAGPIVVTGTEPIALAT